MSFFNQLKNIFTQANSPSNELQSREFNNSFVSLSINTPEIQKKTFQFESKDIEVFHLDKTHFTLFKNQSLYSNEQASLKTHQNFNEKIIKFFNYAIENSKSLLNSPTEISSDINSEKRGQEWIKASLVVLKSAIEKTIEDDDYFFTGKVFYGEKNHNTILRIHVLSLDFEICFLNDHRMRIRVWDYKGMSPNPKSQPSFQGDFAQLKQPIFDEFIKLIEILAKSATKII